MERYNLGMMVTARIRWVTVISSFLENLDKTFGFRSALRLPFWRAYVRQQSGGYKDMPNARSVEWDFGPPVEYGHSPLGPASDPLCSAVPPARLQGTLSADERQCVEVSDATGGLSCATDEDQCWHSFLTEVHGRFTGADSTCAILILDLSRFYFVNVEYGTRIGDVLLRQIKMRLKEATSGHTLVVTHIGDKFAVSSSVLLTVSEADGVALRLLEALEAPFEVEGALFVVGATMGIALAPAEGMPRKTLLKRAWVALCWGKISGRGDRHFFVQRMMEDVCERERFKHDLRGAIRHNEFVLFYEPMFDLIGWNIGGFAVSLGWRHSTRGIIHASEFMPLAEESGCSASVLNWMLCRVAAEAANLSEGTELAVKVPSSNSSYTDIAYHIADALRCASPVAARLELEFVSPLPKGVNNELGAILHGLRNQAGVRLTLAGFGVGYACFDEIDYINPDKVKIDKSLVKDLCSEPGRARVAAIVAYAAKLGVATIAEGVDTWSQAKALASFGCMQAQGQLFGPVVTATAVPALLRHERL